MSVTLILLRHGKSDWDVPVGDRDRPLTGRGRRQAAQAGQWLAGTDLAPQVAVVSPARRARDTWAYASEAGSQLPVEVREQAYTFDGEDLRDLVADLGDLTCAVLVGHNPALAELVEMLTGQQVAMPTSCLAVVELDAWTAPSGRLIAYGRPPQERA